MPVKRLRDALIDFFAEMALRQDLPVIHAQSMRDKINGVPGADGTLLPGGDLVIAGRGRVAVVDVGGRGGPLSILRCWRHITTRPPENIQEVTLFYIAIIRTGHDPSSARLLWEFTASKAQVMAKNNLKLYQAECTRPRMTPQEDVPACTLASCQAELRDQGLLAAFEAWLAREQPVGP